MLHQLIVSEREIVSSHLFSDKIYTFALFFIFLYIWLSNFALALALLSDKRSILRIKLSLFSQLLPNLQPGNIKFFRLMFFFCVYFAPLLRFHCVLPFPLNSFFQIIFILLPCYLSFNFALDPISPMFCPQRLPLPLPFILP